MRASCFTLGKRGEEGGKRQANRLSYEYREEYMNIQA
jgi:hypothetical protein